MTLSGTLSGDAARSNHALRQLKKIRSLTWAAA
jgi:hypothetical protein